MSFVVIASLAIALLVGVPVAAHMLRRGRPAPVEFPPARLVPPAAPTARRRSRIEDKALLGVRGLMVVVLALLGATPLVRCSRLSIDRSVGASVAVALVLDDSMSMRARLPGGDVRWQLALEAAGELTDSMRPGDAAAVVLAGYPARLALGGTTNLEAVRGLLRELEPTDRKTDLAGALSLARSAASALPQADRRIIVLSDLADTTLPPEDPPWHAPLDVLRQEAGDCGITRAETQDRDIAVDVTCNSESAARGRRVELIRASTEPEADQRRKVDSGGQADAAPVTSSALGAQRGTQSYALRMGHDALLDVRLTGDDAIRENDRAPVAHQSRALEVALIADPARLAVATGGPPIIEQALRALSPDIKVHRVPTLPDDPKGLDAFGAIILDDPPGLSPEGRRSLAQWLRQGTVAIAFLGPRAAATPLGSTLEPFLTGAAIRWERVDSGGVDPKSSTWLGRDAESLKDLSPHGRLRFDSAIPRHAKVVARWHDEVPFAVQHRVGLGTVLVAGVPCSVEESDFPLRPGFLALLDSVLSVGTRGTGPRVTEVGTPWVFEGTEEVTVTGPDGILPLTTVKSADGDGEGSQRAAVPSLMGRYWVTTGSDRHERIATVSPSEILHRPIASAGTKRSETDGRGTQVDSSATLAGVLLLLVAAELGLRMRLLWRSRVGAMGPR